MHFFNSLLVRRARDGQSIPYRPAILFGPRIDLLRAPANVRVAGYARYCRKRFVAEELNELDNCAADQIRPPGSRAVIFAIVCQDIRDQDMRRMTVAKLWTAFVGYVLGERIFSRLEIILRPHLCGVRGRDRG